MEKLGIAHVDMQKLAGGFPTMNYFTAYGGFAVYIGFEPIKMNNPKSSFEAFKKYLKKEYNLHAIDFSSGTDYNRVTRLPFTINLKTDKMCIPIEPHWSLDYILEQSVKCNNFVDIEFKKSSVAKYMLEGYDDRLEDEPELSIQYTLSDQGEKWEQEIHELISWGELYYNVFKERYGKKAWDGRHRWIWRGIVPRAIFLDWSLEKTLAVCKEFIELTGQKWSVYRSYVKVTYNRTLRRYKKGLPLTYSIARIFMENPELLKYFTLLENDKVENNEVEIVS